MTLCPAAVRLNHAAWFAWLHYQSGRRFRRDVCRQGSLSAIPAHHARSGVRQRYINAMCTTLLHNVPKYLSTAVCSVLSPKFQIPLCLSLLHVFLSSPGPCFRRNLDRGRNMYEARCTGKADPAITDVCIKSTDHLIRTCWRYGIRLSSDGTTCQEAPVIFMIAQRICFGR